MENKGIKYMQDLYESHESNYLELRGKLTSLNFEKGKQEKIQSSLNEISKGVEVLGETRNLYECFVEAITYCRSYGDMPLIREFNGNLQEVYKREIELKKEIISKKKTLDEMI
jgi:hypothetical protein